MSACSDFAEHVWKPGSCKNCFHPFSAHRAGSGLSLRRNSQRGDEEGAVTAPSPYSKPTIAVKPTMMNLESNETMTDINMNIDQESPRSPVDRFGLKKLLGLSSLYIDKNGCNKAHRETGLRSPENKMDLQKCFSLSALSPSKLSKDSVLISNIFVTQEDGKTCQSFRKNDTCRQINSTETARISKSTYIGNDVKMHHQEHDQASQGMDVSVSSPTKVHNGYESKSSVITEATSTCFSLNVDTIGSTPLSSQQSPPSPSGSSCSYQSSNGSLSEGFGSKQEFTSPQTPTGIGSSLSVSNSSSEPLDKEPIYAESTKKKQRAPDHLKSPTKTKRSPCPSDGPGEFHRATISVMATHKEENNRTFYLSSPDSAVSTQCHFSPSAQKDTSTPAFLWPSPSRSAPSLTPEVIACPPVLSKPQTSPPIPPKRINRTPKLGTSSLTSSLSSPVPLPDLPKLSASSLAPHASSPVPLPELPVLFLVTSKEYHFKVHANNQSAAVDRHKSHHHIPGWNCRIEEEEEDEEKMGKDGERKHPAARQGTTAQEEKPINGEAANWKAQSSPPPITGPGTAPAAASNNGPCQDAPGGSGAGEEGQQNGSMPAKQPSHVGATETLAGGKGAFSHEPHPPPPPPKKLHRLCGRMSGSNMELDRCSNPGSVESCASSLRGLGNVSLQTASTDSLADTGSRDATRRSCSSPFPRSPLPSAPGSPHPRTCDSNQPPPLPEKKMVNRTMSAPDSGKQFIRSYPNLLLTGSETPRCQPEVSSQLSVPSSPVDPKSMFSSNECLERCHAPLVKPSRSRTLDEPLKRRLGVHSRSSITCSSSPQLCGPLPGTELGTAPNVGSTIQLQTLLSNIDSREGVYSKLGGLYAESLRRLALKCEDHFTRSQRNPLRFEESNWSLFRLISNKPSCIGGDAVYYSAACASDPSNSYAVKICKSPSVEAKQGHLYGLSVLQSMPSHFNLQQDCGHFMACVPQSMLPSEEVIKQTASSTDQPMDRERVVVITPDVPQQTAADFVREWGAFHKEQPEVYERRVCFLLLQLCNGLEHLKEYGVTHRDLCLENLLLVAHHRQPLTCADSESSPLAIQRHLPRLLISNFAKAKRRSAEDGAFHSVDPRTKRDHARLAPEIVSAAQYRKFDEFQTGILIYELLHQPNPFEVSPALKEQDYRCEDLPPIPSMSLYSDGLQKLAQLLLQPDPIKRIHIQEAKRILQSLLWGPRKDLMEQQREKHGQGANLMDASRHEGLLNWLDVKRALLMMKFAERSLEPERNAELEDWLCCQYFSSAHPLCLCHTAELLYSFK
ncbi:inactive tyrosine-protein kinase PRAG1-like [Eucyclogobius newberryi]|uniref:inactive tyrosine-protein kinase PRAG1-like n=1 Tax=Eucyclogobius newberryi TaxID=166745 RepID=UPI003B5B5FB0